MKGKVDKLKKKQAAEQKKIADAKRRASMMSQMELDEDEDEDMDVAVSGWSTAPKI